MHLLTKEMLCIGHVVKVPARAKINFCVNKAPKLPESTDIKEQSSLWRRFVYVDFPCQFVDFSINGKDCEKIALLQREMSQEMFERCVKQVDINLDPKLAAMTSGFLRIFAQAVNSYITLLPGGVVKFSPIPIPQCIQSKSSDMSFDML
jgi:hypothetical protein